MPVTTVARKFKTSDGNEFDTQAEAESRQVLLDAIEEVEATLHRCGRRIAESQKTADGKPFSFSHWTYYHIRDNGWNLPSLEEVSFYIWSCRFSVDHNNVLEIREAYGKDERVFDVNNLYADKRKADLALVAVQEARLAEWSDEVAKTKTALTR